MPGLSTGGVPVPLDTDPVGDGALAVRNLAAAIGDPWTAYVPTWTASPTNPSIGNGSLAGSYRLIGKTLHGRIALTIGSTTTAGSGAYIFGLPVAARSADAGILITSVMRDASSGDRFMRLGYKINANSIALTNEAGTHVSAVGPFAWATGDTLFISYTYEIA